MPKSYKLKYNELKDAQMRVEQENIDEINNLDKEILQLKSKIDVMEIQKFTYTEQIGWLRSVIEKSLNGESQEVATLKSELEQMKHLLSDILHQREPLETE